MPIKPLNFTLAMPDWSVAEIAGLADRLPSVQDRMSTILRFARLNSENSTGGPFAAGVFERDSGRPIAIGVNRVLATGCSSAHAEVMAISLAQQVLDTWDLGAAGLPAHQLVVNWRPCAMCYGAVLWSGVRSLVVAGSGSELEEITGFDEGPMSPRWDRDLRERGIEVIDGILWEEACDVFRDFQAADRLVYNARQGPTD